MCSKLWNKIWGIYWTVRDFFTRDASRTSFIILSVSDEVFIHDLYLNLVLKLLRVLFYFTFWVLEKLEKLQKLNVRISSWKGKLLLLMQVKILKKIVKNQKQGALTSPKILEILNSLH